MVDLLSQLNPEQQKVVLHTEGPVLVLAGAGSGKTRTVIFRTAYLIAKKKINPWQILVVTFTNKAARELRDRLENTFNISTRSLWIGTFHSICTKILRIEQDRLPFDDNFSIYDDPDQKSVMKKIYKKLNIDSKMFPMGKVRDIISKQKNNLILPKDFSEFNESNYFSDTVLKIYTSYQNFLLENNALDFDDLIMYTALLLHDHEDIRSKYKSKFRYVMIDEYQDTNYAQFKIINLIALDHQNLCVVGDDDQAIYSWRGADIRNILSFENDYKNVLKVKLEQNYRSPKSFLALANSLIKNNSSRHKKELWTALVSKEKPKLVKLDNENGEADFVARSILDLRSKGTSLNDCVILYRTNAQSRVFEQCFVKKALKYQIVGGVNFYQRKEIKDILAYLRILVNSDDNESLLRVINFPPRGLGAVTIGRLIDISVSENISILDSILKGRFDNSLSNAESKLTAFKTMIERWQKSAETSPVTDLISDVINDLGLLELYENSRDPQDISRSENIREFLAAAEDFSERYSEEDGRQPNLEEYLQNISLQTDLDNYNEADESVKLMTMHNAKGLEFEHVFIVGLEDGLLPHSRSLDEISSLEEERRLLYVAITRAKKSLHLCYATTRRSFDSVQYTYPSRFLMEMDEELLEKVSTNFYDLQIPRQMKKSQKKNNVIFESDKHFSIGQKVNHDKFGLGIILNVEGKGEDARLTISFSDGSLKKIIGTFVKTGT